MKKWAQTQINLTRGESLLLLFCAIFIAVIFWSFVDRLRPKTTPRLEMWHFSSQISLGDSITQVEQQFFANRYKTLEFQGSSDFSGVRTDYEFGAGNWILYIEAENQRVKAIRLRTNDHVSERPRERFAPPDRVEKGWKSPRENWWKR